MWKLVYEEKEETFNDKKSLQQFIANARVKATGKPFTLNVDMYNVCKGNKTAALAKWGITNFREE